MKSLATLALMFAVTLCQAQTEWGNKLQTIYLGTRTSTVSNTFFVGTGNSRAAAGSVLAFVTISTPSTNGGFEVWDSSTTTLTGRSMIFGALCTNLGNYPIFREAQYGLTVISRSCEATMSYLTHK
jgi:hypothetical protein